MASAGQDGAEIAAIVAAASAVAGRQLTDPVTLQAGSGRSVVLRCSDAGTDADAAQATDPGSAATVIVKTYPGDGEGHSSFAAEAAGLALVGGTGLAPALLGADPGLRLVVMSDLGSGASLADLLLGDSAEAARSALLSWASACGRLSAQTSARRPEFDASLAGYLGGRPDESYMAGLSDRILAAGERAGQLSVSAPAGLDADLAEVAGAARSARHAVFSPGDICPDNNMIGSGGLRFLDFESAGFHSVFLDAAYLRMPFSTCWCVFRLPPELTGAAEAAYRAEVREVRPEVADDQLWQAGLRRGVAAWTLSSMWWLLERSIEGDEPTNPEATSPRTRQLIRHRWRTLAAELEGSGELPALAALMRSLLAATEHWHAPDLQLYPAFR